MRIETCLELQRGQEIYIKKRNKNIIKNRRSMGVRKLGGNTGEEKQENWM